MATKNIIKLLEKGNVTKDLKVAYSFMLLSRGYSADEDTGEIRHWHVVFIKKKDGRLIWSLSKPDMHEEDIDSCLI